ncbi:MAG TPA: hypothetical protein DCG28_04205 [Lachnospiraceae bacterium]|nr:hypothetical protein [Lachnospiraceae bacterium]
MDAKKSSNASFVKMAAILAVAGILTRIIGFLYRLPLTNMIGDEGNGIYAAGYNVYNFFLIMSSAGLPTAISRMIAEKAAIGQYRNVKKIFNYSMLVSAGISLFLALIMAGGTFAFQRFCEIGGHTQRLYLWYSSIYCLYSLAPTVFIVGVMSVYRGYFQGLQTTVPTSVSQIIEQIFNAVFSVFLAWLWMKYGIEYGAAGGTAGTGVGAAAGLGVIFIYYLAGSKQRKRLLKEDTKEYDLERGKDISINLIKISVPMIIGTAIFSMTNFVDMAMVESRLAAAGFDHDTVVKLYGQLNGKYVTITTMPVSISTAIAIAVIPSIAASVVRKEFNEVKSKLDTALRVTMILSIPAAFGLGVLGTPILKMLFPRHAEGGSLITAGGLSIIFLALSLILTGVLQGIGNLKAPALNSLWSALIKIPINYVLIAIPQINIIGAIISTTACYFMCSVLNLISLKKETGVSPDYAGILVKPTIASVIMAVFCFLSYKLFYMILPSNTIATLFAIVVAVLVYFIAMALIKGFRRADLNMLPMGKKLIRILEKYNRI